VCSRVLCYYDQLINATAAADRCKMSKDRIELTNDGFSMSH